MGVWGFAFVMQYLRRDVAIPFVTRAQKDFDFASRYPFRLSQKKLELSYSLPSVFRDMESYKHKTDGLIFTSQLAPYIFGTCEKILKWKPSEENTVDFKLLYVNSSFRIAILVRDDHYQEISQMTVEKSVLTEWGNNAPINQIIECHYDPFWPNFWRYSRIRTDKLTANHISTYEKIMESIRDNVTKQELLDYCPELKSAWKARNACS